MKQCRWKLCSALLVFVVFVVGQNPAVATAGAGKVQIVGAPNMGPIVRELIRKFEKSGAVDVVYREESTNNAAAYRLTQGHDLMFSWGDVGSGLADRTQRRWEELSPGKHVVGAMAIACVVHAENPVSSLSLAQLRSIFSSQNAGWASVGGDDAPVRRYTPPYQRPFMAVYRERCQPVDEADLMRKEGSKEVLAAVASDVQAIGVVDPARVPATGMSAKELSINGVQLSAQSVRSGRYPLARQLVMYVSPRASDGARDFADFVMSDEHNDVLRESGIVPALRGTSCSTSDGFKHLYGPDLQRVRATEGKQDDLRLAADLINAARTMNTGSETIRAMGNAAFELASSAPGGETVAFKAIYLTAGESEDYQLEVAMDRLALYTEAYRANSNGVTGNNLVSALMFAANMATRQHDHITAARLWRRARDVAQEQELLERGMIKRRLEEFRGRARTQKRIYNLIGSVKGGFENETVRRKVLNALLIELDHPAEAEKVLTQSDEGAYRTNIPLAKQPIDTLSEESALKLAEWYIGLIRKADSGGRELMVRRAKDYYHRFFQLHAGREDQLAQRAGMGLKKIGGQIPPPGKNISRGWESARYELRDLISDLRLAEYVARHPNLRKLDQEKIGSFRHVTDLRPLAYLKNVQFVELRDARKIKSLQPLGSLSRLKHLRIIGTKLEDLSDLVGAESLEVLEIRGASQLGDLDAIGELKHLRRLQLSKCPGVTDLSPLEDLDKLRKLDLSGCHNLRDLQPLEKLDEKLQELILRDCRQLKDVYPLSKCTALKRLDLRGCPNVPKSDVEWLGRQIPDCRIQGF